MNMPIKRGKLRVVTVFLAGTICALANAEELPHFATRELSIRTAITSVGAAPVASYQLWVTTDGGRSWARGGAPYPGPAPVPFVAPGDGRYGFLVAAFDSAGLGSRPPQPGQTPDFECVVDTEAPALEVLRPETSDAIYAGGQVICQWRALDASLGPKPVRIEYRRRPDPVWQPILPENDFIAEGSQAWWPPFVDGEVDLRIVATDRAGNRSEWELPAPLRVIPFDGFRGSRVLAATPYSSFHSVPIFYRIQEYTLVELEEVELWYRHETSSWARASDPDKVSPYRFEARLDGNYFFYLRATNRNGVATREPPGADTPPDLRVIVDTHSPEGALRVGNGERKVFHRAGDPLEIAWQLADANLRASACRLEYSLDSGHDWRSLANDIHLSGGNGTFLWRAPLLEIGELRVRLVARDYAGNQTYVESDSILHLINPTVDPKAAAQDFYQRGLFLSRLGDRASLMSALENFDVALTYDPEHALAWHDRGAIRMLLNLPLAAIADFERARELRPRDLDLTFSLIRAHLHVARSGKDPQVDHTAMARTLFESVSRVDIYKEINYRELLNEYQLLEQGLGSK
ncbi:MAG: hypothetical protein AB7O52_12110 [Planctomycetota bacterium]